LRRPRLREWTSALPIAQLTGGFGDVGCTHQDAPRAATPAGRWWPAQNILSGTAYKADSLGLAADRSGASSSRGTGGRAIALPPRALSADRSPYLSTGSSGTPTFGPGGVAKLVGIGTRPPGGSFAPAQAVTCASSADVDGLSVAVESLGDTTSVAPSADQSSSVPDAYYEPAGGLFRSLDVPGGAYSAVASDEAGGTALASYLPSGPDGLGLYPTRRSSPMQPFGAPVLSSATSPDPAPQLAHDGEGGLTTAWADQGGHIEVTTAAGDGAPVAPQVLSAPDVDQASDERLSLDDAGDAVLAWGAGPTSVYAAIRTGSQFQAPQLLTTGASDATDG